MDVAAHQVWRGESEVALSATEFRLLRYLMANQGRVLSRLQILDHVWDYDFGGDSQVVATYISYLRKKLEDDSDPPLIQTVRGVGYVMRPPAPKREVGPA
jgi:two-component system OmpR family response regulator